MVQEAPQDIRITVPRMPDAEALMLYLRRIDEARYYSNFGPLVQEFEARARSLSNFGFRHGRNAALAGFNIKLSEYAAAVGLAALDAWPFVRTGYVRLGQAYAAALSAIEGVTVMPGFGQDWAGTTCNVEFSWPDTGKVARHLAGAGIESRHWWARGCHQQEAFAACSSTPLEVARHLADHTLALPFHLRLGPAELNRIVMSLAASLGDAGEALDERTVAQAG